MNNVILNNDDCKTQLKTILETQLRASRKDDKKADSDSKKLLPFLINYLESDKSNMEWTMGRLRTACYDLIEYNPSAKDSIKSYSFEHRVTRAIKDSLLVFRGVNPLSKNKFDDFKNGYQINDNGNLTLPENIVLPEKTEEVEGVKIKVPNDKTDRIEIGTRLRHKHFSKVFSIGRKSNSGTGETKYNELADTLTKWLNGLSNDEIYDFGNTYDKAFKKLETAIDKMYETKSSLELVGDTVIDTRIKEAS
mgnify:FL=1